MCRFGLGRSSSGGRRRAPTATGRLRSGPGGSGGWCITPGQDVLDRLGLLLYRRELLGEALDGVAEQPCLGDGGVEKACFVGVLHLCQVEPEMALLDHHGGHRLPEGQPHRTFLREREPISRCCNRHPIHRWRTELNAGRPVGRTSEITREPDRMFAA